MFMKWCVGILVEPNCWTGPMDTITGLHLNSLFIHHMTSIQSGVLNWSHV